jgi:mRNA interferase MazF
MNRFIGTIIVAPLTTGGRQYPTRIPVVFQGKQGHIVLNQIRTVDKRRPITRLGRLDDATVVLVATTLREMFAL